MDDEYFRDEEEFSIVRSLMGLLTFSTIIPFNVHTSMEYMTRFVWCWPFLHLLVGLLAMITALICSDVLHLNMLFVSVIVYAFLMLITGYNHLDGVMDMADGVMVHGKPEHKMNVVKDSSVGAGGIATLFLVASLTIGAIYNVLSYDFAVAIIISEMLAKTSLLTTALTSRPAVPGIGSYFIFATNSLNYAVSTAVVAVLSFILGGVPALIGLLGAVIAGFCVTVIARRNFGVANGDVLGMSNELGRLIALLFMAITLYYI